MGEGVPKGTQLVEGVVKGFRVPDGVGGQGKGVLGA